MPPSSTNPLGLKGIEFIEYITDQPVALGAILDRMGFVAVARHRSREVMLYRQGPINLVVNAAPQSPEKSVLGETERLAPTRIGAVAMRVDNAAVAHKRLLDLGAWDQPTRAAEMELNIPGIRGPGESLIYFVDRTEDFSIYDVDFVPLAQAPKRPPSAHGLHVFGVVQTVFSERSAEWIDFYQSLLGFHALPDGKFFGIINKGVILQSPCQSFYWQLIEPPSAAAEVDWQEGLYRLGLGSPDVPAVTRDLQSRGVQFIDRGAVHSTDRGAVTQVMLGGVCFELVHSASGA